MLSQPLAAGAGHGQAAAAPTGLSLSGQEQEPAACRVEINHSRMRIASRYSPGVLAAHRRG
ncbi:hypothetical protein HMPREF9946_01856 [Acetobacteraceae bacterium AT-5844]|nr:hypothetical protein HMPREF9946_01856 [Acetobacteraceae bacterium AT-5844]